jgi:hypothetical protein
MVMDSEKQFTPPNGFVQLLGIGRTNGDGLLGVGLLGVGRTVLSSFRQRGFGSMVSAKITGESDSGRFPPAYPAPKSPWLLAKTQPNSARSSV